MKKSSILILLLMLFPIYNCDKNIIEPEEINLRYKVLSYKGIPIDYLLETEGIIVFPMKIMLLNYLRGKKLTAIVKFSRSLGWIYSDNKFNTTNEIYVDFVDNHVDLKLIILIITENKMVGECVWEYGVEGIYDFIATIEN